MTINTILTTDIKQETALAPQNIHAIRGNITALAEEIVMKINTEELIDYTPDFSKELSGIFRAIIEGERSPIFQKFRTEDGKINEDKFKNKVDIYSHIHTSVLMNYIQNVIENDERIQTIRDADEDFINTLTTGKPEFDRYDTDKKKKILINSTRKSIIQKTLMKYLRIVLTFSEKIPPDVLRKCLDIGEETATKINKEYTEKLFELAHKEKKINTQNNENTLFAPRMLENAYKILLTKKTHITRLDTLIHKDQDDTIKGSKILEAIQDMSQKEIILLLQSALMHDLKLFSFILEDEINIIGKNGKPSATINELDKAVQDTKKIISIFQEIGFDMSILKGNEAFSELENIQKINLSLIAAQIENIDEDLRTKEFAGIKKKKLFVEYLHNLETKSTTEFWEKVQKGKQKVLEKKIPPDLDNVDLADYDSSKITLDEWIEIPERQKYDFLFTQIFSSDKVHLSLNTSALEIDTLKENAELFIKSIHTGKSPLKKEIIQKRSEIFLNQMQEIQNISAEENTDLYSFVKNSFNHINVLMAWWKFLLQKRYLKEQGSEITVESLQNLPQNTVIYGVGEKIFKRLPKKYQGEIDIKTNRPMNTSVRGVNMITKVKRDALIKEDVKINQEDITRIDYSGEKIETAIKDIVSTYIPDDIAKIKKSIDENTPEYAKLLREKQIQAIRDWITVGISTCRKLLVENSNYTDDEQKYIHMLKKIGIMEKDEVTPKQEDIHKVQSFISRLKYISSKLNDLVEMFQVNDSDLDTIRKILNANNRSKEVKERPQKEFVRAFVKYIKDHCANGNRITDLGGGLGVQTSIQDNIEVVVDQIQYLINTNEVTHISIIDKISDPMSFSQLSSGYRDTKLLVTLKSGNTIEIQFHMKSMFDMKTKGPKRKQFRLTIEEIRGEDMLFSLEEMEKIINFAKKTQRKLPHPSLLNALLSKGKIAHIPNIFPNEVFGKKPDGNDETILKEFSLDNLYNIIRAIEDPIISTKLDRLHRALADVAFGPLAADYLIEKRAIKK